MTGDPVWPTLPRLSLVRAVTTGVDQGTSVGALVHGEPGVGKTTLALAAAAALTADDPARVVLRLRGSEVTSSVPYGLLHGLLHEADDAAFGTSSSVLRHLTAVIGAPAGGGPTVVVVDNAHLIDEFSAHALGQLAALGRAVLIAAVPSLAEAPDAFLELWRDGMLASVPVPLLMVDEVGEILAAFLEGPVVAPTVALLAERSGGNPLFLQYLTTEQLGSEALVRRDGIWLLVSPATLSNQQMLAQLKARLDRWGPAQREILEIVALTDTIPYGELAKLSDEDEVSVLLANGVLELVPGAQPRVQVRHRLVAEVIRAGVSFARRRQLRERLAPLYEDVLGQSPESALAFCAWTLDCGVALGPELALTAAVAANQLYDPEFALRVAAAVPPGPLALAAAVQKSRAWRTLGLHPHAVGVLRPWYDADQRVALGSAELVDLAVEVAAVACQRRSEATTAEVILAEALARVAGDAPVTRRLELARWELLIALGAHQAALPGLEGAYAVPDDDPTGSWVAVAAMFAESLAAVGRQQEALAVVAVIEQTHSSTTPSEEVCRLRDSAVFGALLNCGMWDQGIRVLSRESDPPLRGLYFGAAADSAIGVSHLYGGRARDALDRLPGALGQLTVRDSLGNRRQVLAALAYSYALLGQAPAAQGYLRALDEDGPADGQVPARTRLMALSAQALVGNADVVTEEMLALAGDYRTKGVAMDELVVLAAAARMGSAAALEQLQTPWMAEPGPMAAAIHRWARAVKVQDPGLVLDAAAELLDLGNELMAREAAVSVAETATGALKVRALDLAKRASDALQFAAQEATSRSLLTRREGDVATRAADGRTNKEIADELFLSVRTVESYLQSVFGKLGITSRADLAAALV